MRIAIGCDDTGFPLKEHVSAALEASGHDLLDLGTFSTDPVDHPDYARAVGQAVLRGFVDAGLLICGSGVGACIAANKIRGIRASLCQDPDAARLAREEDDANVLCLGARQVAPARAVAIVMAWIAASFSGEERFARKIAKVALLESGLTGTEKVPTRPAATAALPPAAPTPTPTSAVAAPAAAPVTPAAAVAAPAAAPVTPAAAVAAPAAAPVTPASAVAAPAAAPVTPASAVAAPAAAPVTPASAIAAPAAAPVTPASPVAAPAAAPVTPASPVAAPAAAPVTPASAIAAPSPASRPPVREAPVEAPARPLREIPKGRPPVKPEVGGTIRTDDRYMEATAPPMPRPVDEVFKLPPVQEALDGLEAQDFLDRLWVKDATLWKGEGPAIRNRLGWLTSPTIMRGHTDDIKAFADEIRRLQFTHVVLLGMGGASLGANVFNLAFGSKMGFPDLLLLDTTDPAAVRQTLERLNLARTLFIVASKSGDTPETLAFYEYFRGQVESSSVPRAGIHFVAITDPGRPLDKIASETGFRRTFLNPASIGARYSALSFFGLVPAALMGIDIKTLLDRAHAMVEACGNAVGARDNAAVRLGGALAGLSGAGRDKVTLVLSRKLRGLGPWIEHLLAESLAKGGKGVVPVDDEPLGSPVVYGDDRVFVAITLDEDDTAEPYLDALQDAGHPVIRIPVKDPTEVGAEFFRWELAAAAAGVALGINPFDEPEVVRLRDNAATLLTSWKKTRRLPEWLPDAEENGLVLMTNMGKKPPSLSLGLQAFLTQAGPGDYIAIHAYLTPSADTWSRLQELRILLRDRLKVATTLAFGPRYLHSTSQLHLGGRPNGLFLQLTGEDKEDIVIPGAGYGFATLKAAQALAELQTLRDAGRRIVRMHLAGKQLQALEQLVQLVQRSIKKR
jgi:RpiB/LacA/LacB family sugar-phosphate isomerase